MFAILLHEGMNPFYQNIASFPTVVFTFVLGVCVFYWLCAVLGVVDIDALDIDAPDVDADLAGAEQGTEGYSPNVLAGLLMRFGLTGVPLTIIISFIALFGWLLCYFTVHFLFSYVPTGLLRYIAGFAVLVGTLYISAMVTSVIIRPLRVLFNKASEHTVKQVLGQTATVRTSYVDADFGEATLEDGGAGLILKVRAGGDQRFKKGDRVVLLEYREDSNTYRVISEQEFSG